MLACAYAHDRSLIRTSMTEVGFAGLHDTSVDDSMVRVLAARSARAESEADGRRARSLDEGSIGVASGVSRERAERKTMNSSAD